MARIWPTNEDRVRSFTAVVNPAAGTWRVGRHAQSVLAPVAGLLRDAGAQVTVEYSHDLEHAAKLATAATERGDVVLAVGGDGTVGSLAGAVSRADGVLGIVPAGRGNDFGHQLAVPTDPNALAQLLRTAEPRSVDVIEAADRLVVGSIYAGIDAVANVHLQRVPMLGGAGYHYAAARALLTWRMASYRLTVDETPLERRGYTVVAANSGFYGNGRHAAPDAHVDDGLLDVVILRDISRRGFVSIAMRELYSGSHVRRPEVEIIRAREIRIDADRPLPFGGDGELIGRLPVSVRVRPAALRVLARPPA